MYISKIVLRNIRCFRDFTLEFEKKQRSLLLVGDNGEGKSTLLRSIAMGLCDESSAAALFRELPGKFVKQGREKEGGRIDIHLSDTSGCSFIIETKFEALGKLERVRQTLYRVNRKLERVGTRWEKFPWGRIFVTGYGPGVRMLGSETPSSYLPADAVYSLFRYDEPLQNPELALRRLKDEGEKRRKKVLKVFLELLRVVLNLRKHDRVYLEKTGIEVRSRWGRHQLETLGDGYRSTVTWVLDLIGRRLLFGRTLDPERMTGIVLLDEVEQHLHPKWQLNVMPLITEAFPRIQFIVTTHSPLVVSGCKKCAIRKITSDHNEPDSAYGWRPQDVYRNVMDLDKLRIGEVEERLRRYQRLELRDLSGNASDKDRREMKRLKQKLDKTLHGSDPTIVSLELKNIKRYLKKLEG